MHARYLLILAPILATCVDESVSGGSTDIRIEGADWDWRLKVGKGLRVSGTSGVKLDARVTDAATYHSNQPIETQVEGLVVKVGPDGLFIDGRAHGALTKGQAVVIDKGRVRVDGEDRGPFPPEKK